MDVADGCQQMGHRIRCSPSRELSPWLSLRRSLGSEKRARTFAAVPVLLPCLGKHTARGSWVVVDLDSQWPRRGPVKGRETSTSGGWLKRTNLQAYEIPRWDLPPGQCARVAGSIPAGGTRSTCRTMPACSRPSRSPAELPDEHLPLHERVEHADERVWAGRRALGELDRVGHGHAGVRSLDARALEVLRARDDAVARRRP
jgi:hypothetical protein